MTSKTVATTIFMVAYVGSAMIMETLDTSRNIAMLIGTLLGICYAFTRSEMEKSNE